MIRQSQGIVSAQTLVGRRLLPSQRKQFMTFGVDEILVWRKVWLMFATVTVFRGSLGDL